MSHANISRDVDIDTYVLQKDTAMNPYIVHMKTDVGFGNLVPESIRPQKLQKSIDMKKRDKIIKDFGKQIEKLIKQIEKISKECVKKGDEVAKQLSRLTSEDEKNIEDRQSLVEFQKKINEFANNVKDSRLDFLKPGNPSTVPRGT